MAHPNVQQLLASIWYEGLPGFRRKNMALQALEIVRIGEYGSGWATMEPPNGNKPLLHFRHAISIVLDNIHNCTAFEIRSDYAKTIHKIHLSQRLIFYIPV